MDGVSSGVPIPEFIHHVAEGEFEEAIKQLQEKMHYLQFVNVFVPQEKINVKR